MDRKTYTITEAIEILGVSRSTIGRWIKAKRLRASVVGGITLIRAEAIEAMLDENLVGASA